MGIHLTHLQTAKTHLNHLFSLPIQLVREYQLENATVLVDRNSSHSSLDTIQFSRKLEISQSTWVCENPGLLWGISGSTGCLCSHSWLMPQTPRPRDYSHIRDVFLPSLAGGMQCICTDDSHSLKVAAGVYLRIFNIAFMIICRQVNHATEDYLSLNTALLMISG